MVSPNTAQLGCSACFSLELGLCSLAQSSLNIDMNSSLFVPIHIKPSVGWLSSLILGGSIGR